jgi:hypothetical protein
MRLPRLSPLTKRNDQRGPGDDPKRGATLAQIPSIPATVALALARDYSIDQITGGTLQCVATLNSILSDFQRCVDGGTNVRCENIAARQIATIACRSYCSCG